MRIFKIALSLLLVAIVLVGAWLAKLRFDSPDLSRFDRYVLPVAPATGDFTDSDAAVTERVTVTFLGVSTVLISDGETNLMTDGFFSRPPGILRLGLAGAEVESDKGRIAAALDAAGVFDLAAVIAVHSHYDHAMDSPFVAELTDAVLVGSESTANVGRGWGLDEARILVPEPGQPLRFGAFTVTLIESRHYPLPFGESLLDKPIVEPLVQPASIFEYLEGGSFSVLVEHKIGSILIQGSAGFIPGALEGREADVVLLGIGGLGRADIEFRSDYYREIVEAVGARRVAPIHWDDFTRPLSRELVPTPRLLDDVAATMDWLAERTSAAGAELIMLPVLDKALLFESVAPETSRDE
jgi:L-ascorbate metabolism protein UlaG (beta-lactamase superfamily)